MPRRQLAYWRVWMWLIAVGSGAVLATAALTGQRSTAQAQETEGRLGRQPGLSVVGISARIGRDDVKSSGIIIDADRGLVLTSAHPIWGAKSLRVATDLAVLYGRIVARDACDDLALVELQPRLPGLRALSLDAPGEGVRRVEVIGRRFAAPSRPGEDLIRIPTQLRRDSKQTGRMALPSPPESSGLDSSLPREATGAPLLDSTGSVWGAVQVIAPRGRAPRARAIPASAIADRLSELRPGTRTVYAGWRDRYRCAPRLHAYSRDAHPGFVPDDARINARVPATRVPGTEELDKP